MTPTQDLFAQATELHKAGKLDAAFAMFAKVAAREPANAPALHWMGFIHNQRGEFDRAIEVLKQAIMARPGVPSFHITLAETYRNLGERKRAVGCCRTALKLNPDYPEALCTLGPGAPGFGSSGGGGRTVPACPRNCGPTLRRPIVTSRWRYESSAVMTRHSSTCVLLSGWRPATPRLAVRLCLLLLDRGEAEEAVVHGQEAVKLQPDVAIYHHNLGNAL